MNTPGWYVPNWYRYGISSGSRVIRPRSAESRQRKWAFLRAAAAGARHGQLMTPATLRRVIRDAGRLPVQRTTAYETIREFTVEHSTARHAALESGETYMVGSLARLKLWGDRLDGAAAQARDELFPAGGVDNVLMNTRAQIVETVYCVESAITFCDAFLALEEIETELQEVEGRAGCGVAAIEAPRGTLFHEYELDEDGKVLDRRDVTRESGVIVVECNPSMFACRLVE